MTSVRTILVPIDFSEGSRAALMHARDLAAIFNCQVHLLHVATGAPAWAVEVFAAHLPALQKQHRLDALDKLATYIVSARLDPMKTTGLVRLGRADEAIAEYASEIRADLIVMGTHGDHPSVPFGVGHVIERVLGRVNCPVLTIPERDAKFARSRAVGELQEEIA